MDIPNFPFETMHIDHLGPFVRNPKENEHLLVIVDVVICPVKSTKTKPAVDAFHEWSLHFGMPKALVTDRGTEVTSNCFENFCAEITLNNCI